MDQHLWRLSNALFILGDDVILVAEFNWLNQHKWNGSTKTRHWQTTQMKGGTTKRTPINDDIRQQKSNATKKRLVYLVTTKWWQRNKETTTPQNKELKWNGDNNQDIRKTIWKKTLLRVKYRYIIFYNTNYDSTM